MSRSRTTTPQDDVNIDYVDNGYAPHLQELHAQMLPGNALRQAPETVLADLTEDAFAVEVKRVNGSITYATGVDIPQEVEAEQYDTMDNLTALLADDRYAIARMSVFCDSYFVRAYPDAALRVESGSFWYDAASMAWLDPSHPQTLVYITSLCQEYAQLGFDEILLTDCGFPTQGDLDSLRAVEEKEETLETFCRQLQGALADTPVTLSVMGQRDSVTADPVSGQTTALLATFGRVWTQAEDQETLAAFDPVVLPAVS